MSLLPKSVVSGQQPVFDHLELNPQKRQAMVILLFDVSKITGYWLPATGLCFIFRLRLLPAVAS
jgi:hypothetical protein